MYTLEQFTSELDKLQDLGPDSLQAMRDKVTNEYFDALDAVRKLSSSADTIPEYFSKLVSSVDAAAELGKRFDVWTTLIDKILPTNRRNNNER